MPAADYDFTDDQAIEQGATWSRQFNYKDPNGVAINLTGYTARMQVRAKRTNPEVLLELTTENGGIVLGGADGSVTLQASAVDTAAFTWTRGVYDVELISAGGIVTRFIRGSVSVSPEVTRP
jgi:hypothetical protein